MAEDERESELVAQLRSELRAARDQIGALTSTVGELSVVIAQQGRTLAVMAAAAAAGGSAARSTLTWRQLWADHYKNASADRVESADSDSGRAEHIIRHIGDVLVVETTIHTVRFYRNARKSEFTIRKTLTKPKTRNNEVELMRRMSRWASREKPPLIPIDPLAGIDRVELYEPVDNIRRNVIEDDPQATLTLQQFLDHGDELDQALVLVAHSSGMRRAEIAKLEMDWIDRRPGPDGKPQRIVEIPPGVSKGRRGRRPGRQTWISVEALEAIDRYRRTLPFPLQRRAPWVFVNTVPGKYFGKHLHPDTLTSRFKTLQERAGATGPSGPAWLHDLRRSFITLARRRGEDTSNIKQAAGQRTDAAFERYDIHARKDVLVVRDRVEAARAKEMVDLVTQRKGPQRALPGDANNADETKNKR